MIHSLIMMMAMRLDIVKGPSIAYVPVSLSLMWVLLAKFVLSIPLFIKQILFYALMMPFLLVVWVVAILIRASPITFVTHMMNYESFRKTNRDGNRPSLPAHVKEIIFNKKNGTEVYVPRFHALEKGPKNGPLMVFLHGFPESYLSWRNQMDKFSKTYRCVALSLPGYGQSARTGPLREYQLASLVLQVVGAIRHLSGCNGKAIVVGHDWGGMVAYGVAILHPEVVDKLIVMSCPHPLLYLTNMSFSQAWKSLYFILFQMPYLPEVYFSLNKYEIILQAASSLSQEDAMVMQWCISHPETITPALNYYRNLFSLDYGTFHTCITKQLDMPVLVLWGSNDEYVMPSLTRGLNKVASGAVVYILKGAGHFIQQEVPDQVNSRMQNFLDTFTR